MGYYQVLAFNNPGILDRVESILEFNNLGILDRVESMLEYIRLGFILEYKKRVGIPPVIWTELNLFWNIYKTRLYFGI